MPAVGGVSSRAAARGAGFPDCPQRRAFHSGRSPNALCSRSAVLIDLRYCARPRAASDTPQRFPGAAHRSGLRRVIAGHPKPSGLSESLFRFWLCWLPAGDRGLSRVSFKFSKVSKMDHRQDGPRSMVVPSPFPNRHIPVTESSVTLPPDPRQKHARQTKSGSAVHRLRFSDEVGGD